MSNKKVLVVGAGAAGLMASVIASQNSNDVILLEQNETVGKKLKITGKGRCNLTNNCSIDEFLKNIVDNRKFLYSAISKFPPQDTINFFEKNGLKLKTERGNRVFPVSDKAQDVVDTFKRILKRNNCKIIYKKVKNLFVENSICKGVICKGGEVVNADSVILATGGVSYPLTGSTGDGFKMAKELGHTINPLKPSLVPLVCKQSFCQELQGLTLKNVSISVFENSKSKEVYKDFGEMIFTHFGVSGPIILSASCHLKDIFPGKYSIKIDLKPALDSFELDKRVVKDFEKYSNKNFINSLSDLLPKKLIPVIVKLSGINSNLKCHQITKEMRSNLVYTLKNLTIDVLNYRPIEEAIITSGGICTSEINPKTMESKLIKNLFFAGEIIDVNAYTGGFNLQIAFSTGFVAGSSV